LYIIVIIPSNLYKLSLTLIDTEEGHLLIENVVNIFFVTSLSVSLHNLLDFYIVDVVEWSRALDVRLSEWCCGVTMVWVQIPSREEKKLTALKSNSNTVWFNFQTYKYTGFEPTPLLHCSPIRLALRPGP
jgi:hypothetical protein